MDLQQLQENWPLLGGAIVGLIAWGKTTADAISAKKNSTSAHVRINDVERYLKEVAASTARIETDQKYLKEGVDGIREEQRRVYAALNGRN